MVEQFNKVYLEKATEYNAHIMTYTGIRHSKLSLKHTILSFTVKFLIFSFICSTRDISVDPS